MSNTVVEGKDTIKFFDEQEINQAAAEAEANTTSEQKEEQQKEEEPASAFNPETGEINWDCPCKYLYIITKKVKRKNSI